eukprot:43806-Rhodomonas_salina.2
MALMLEFLLGQGFLSGYPGTGRIVTSSPNPSEVDSVVINLVSCSIRCSKGAGVHGDSDSKYVHTRVRVPGYASNLDLKFSTLQLKDQ